MQLRYEQVNTQLHNRPLAPIYFVSGEEPLLVQIACDTIRNTAKQQGFSERKLFHVETGFDWQNLLLHSHNYGLFSEKQILELHLHSISEGTTEALKTYANNPPADKLLLLIMGKLERRLQQTAWFKCIDKIGICIFIWPMEKSQFRVWVAERLSMLPLKIEPEAIEHLISVTEGNLLAAAQEIEKLSFYFATDPIKTITSDRLIQALSDNARFDVFKLTDAALQGEAARCLRILNRLKEEGIEPILILWALSRECRQLASLALQLTQGKPIKTLFQQVSIWEKRQPLFQRALQRHSFAHWYTLLQFAAHCDRVIKGVEWGNVWQSLQQLSLAMAGITNLC